MSENWEAAYADAILETDRQRLAGKIENATVALRACLSELGSSAQDVQQKIRIEDALRTLDILRRTEPQVSV